MAAVNGKDTKPEMIVLKYLFSLGLRLRVQVRKLPGTPDIVLPKYKTVIFVDGCFWHGHEGCKYFRLPKSNVEFWKQEIKNNKACDVSDKEELKLLGWRVVRVWGCNIRKIAGMEEYLQGLYDTITKPRPNDYDTDYETVPLAAEPENMYGHNKGTN